MEYKINKQDLEKMKKAERNEYLEHYAEGGHCYCVNCEGIRLRVQRGYWYKKCKDNNKKILKLIDKRIKDLNFFKSSSQRGKGLTDETKQKILIEISYALIELTELRKSITLIIGNRRSEE